MKHLTPLYVCERRTSHEGSRRVEREETPFLVHKTRATLLKEVESTGTRGLQHEKPVSLIPPATYPPIRDMIVS